VIFKKNCDDFVRNCEDKKREPIPASAEMGWNVN
jgi:hypothetical protein